MGRRSREKLARRSLGEGGREKSGFQFRSGLEKACLFVITWGTYLVLFTPVIINTNFFFPFVAPKTIFFRMVVEILLAAYVFLVIAKSSYRPRINALTIAITLFLGVFILASFTGVNLGRSFWSTNERMTGILTMLHLFAFFIILSSVFKNKKDWERALGVSILVGVILSIYILMGDEVSTRGGGTIGNTSFMAAYLLFDVFFAIILFLAKKGWWQIFSGICLTIMLPVLFTSTARGAIMAFGGGLFLLGLGYLAFSQKKALKRVALAIVLALIVFGTVSVILQPPFVKDRVTTTLTDMKSRFVVWEKGWKGFQERPVLGWGPENFIVVFDKYFNPCMFLQECGNEIWFDRVHNIVLDTLVTTGLVGLLSYLAIFIVVIYGLLRITPKIGAIEKRNIFFPLGLIVLLLVYFFQNLLVFDMINTYLVFFLSLALANFLIQKQAAEEIKAAAKPVNPVLASAVVVATIFSLGGGNIQPLIANHYLIDSVRSQNVDEASAFFRKSLGSWMEKYEPREYFSQKMTMPISQSVGGKDKEAFQAALDLAELEMEKSIEANSLDFRPHLFLGKLYFNDYQFSGDQEKLKRSEQVLGEAIQLSPTNQQGYWHLAETKLAMGKAGEATSLLQKAVELEPRVGYSHWYLAILYKIVGQGQLARDEVIKAEEAGFSLDKDLSGLKRAIEICLAVNDDANLIRFYSKAVMLEPSNAQLWAGLAASYANLGQFEEAREAAQKVIEIDPDSSSRVKEFLDNLPKQ